MKDFIGDGSEGHHLFFAEFREEDFAVAAKQTGKQADLVGETK